MRALSVWWDGVVVGTLQVNPHGEMRFTYAAGWLADASRPAISFSLPKQEQPFKQRQCRPFFAGLLPEESQRDVIAGTLGISAGNDFAFLEALGGDVAGALSLWPEGEVPPPPPPGTPRPLRDDELVELLSILPRRPLLAGQKGFRLSLAGAQTKLPVVLIDDRVALPAPGQPTTHILKPAISRFPNTTENEALVMTLATAVGLPAAPVVARNVDGRPYLLVTRYDRRFDAGGRAHRLHQEDFCQALGVPPERKYAAEGGPTFKSGFDLLRRATTRPAGAVLAFLDAAIFNLIVGNADAHGKNFSLLYQGADVSLAPFYDLLSTVAYPDLSPSLAMKIAKRATLEEIRPTTWPAFGDDIGVPPRFVRRRVVELAEAVLAEVVDLPGSQALAGLDGTALAQYSSVIASRAERVARTGGTGSFEASAEALGRSGRYNRRVTGLAVVALVAALTQAAPVPSAAQTGPVIPKAPDADALLAQAVQLHEAGDLFGAVTNYEAYLKSDANNAGVRSNLGAAYVRLGRVAEGVAEYRKALAIEPGNPTYRFNLALALYRTAQYAEAVTELQGVLARQDDHLSARLLLGDCYLRQGRFQEVVDLLAPWEDSYGGDRGFAYVLGSAFIETDRIDHGQRLIEQIFKSGESAEAHLLMGTVHLRAGDSPAALVELKKAVELNPTMPVANGLLGRALLRNGEHEAAQRAFLRELEINPDDFNANLQVSELKKREQKFEEARTYIERALRMRPDDVTAKFGLAGVHISLSQNEEARKILEEVVAAAPKYSEAVTQLALVYYRLNRREDGDRMRARVQELNAEAQARQPGAQPQPPQP
jgi:serine/threonine-protein kinase HipA